MQPKILLAGVLFAGALLTAAQADEPPAIRTATAAFKNLPDELTAIGTVVPIQSVDLRSRIDSQIMEIRFHDGDTVSKGDVLFVLDDRLLKAQSSQLEANLARDEAQAENMKSQFDRAHSLFAKGFSTQQSSDDAKAAFDAQTSAVAADKAALDNVKVQLGFAQVEAPIAGRTGTINVTVGNTVKANDTQSLVTLNQIAPIYVQASFPQTDFDDLRRALKAGNAAATAARDEGHVRETGKLQYMDNAIDATTGTFVVRAAFDNGDEKLWPGMAVTLTASIPQDKPSLSVPADAIQHGPDGDYVFVIRDGKAARKAVTVSREQGGDAVLEQGLQENDVVALSGFLKIEDGSPVTVSAGEAK